jgi:hypothetical protein
MRCKQVERRLNELLDQRQQWTADPALVAHCAGCRPCRAIADAYTAVADAAAATDAVPDVSRDFSVSVLSEFRSAARTTTDRRSWTWPTIAAAVLVAGIPCALLIRSSSLLHFDSQQAIAETGAKASWQFQGELAQLLEGAEPSSEFLWRSTGRGIAVLPHQVRRAAVLSESAHLSGAIRPVAVAWSALRRVLPGEAMRAAPAEGETGFYETVHSAVYV